MALRVVNGSPLLTAYPETMEDADFFDWTDETDQSMNENAANNQTIHTRPLREPYEATDITMSTADANAIAMAATEFNTPPDNTQRQRRASFYKESASAVMLRLSNEFAPLIEEDADTLVYIGIPPQTKGQTDRDYKYTQQQFERPFLMRSATLGNVDSAMFGKFLGPMSARVARRLKKLDIHKKVSKPENIKFYIDLSPAINDEDALIQLTELTVPQGALQWHRIARPFMIDPSHVCGRDDLNVPPQPGYTLVMTKTDDTEQKPDSTKNANVSESGDAKATPPRDNREGPKYPACEYNFSVEEEYTPVRHHTAIMRLLHAIAGDDPKLNSAPKVWTFCMLAKYYDCAQHPRVSHWIVSWLLEKGNQHFIQNNPDIAYRIAVATQSVWLLRCTFAMMVGQQSLIEAADEPVTNVAASTGNTRTEHPAKSLDDDDINRVDHAASALTRRMREVFEEIAVFPGIWETGRGRTPELAKLYNLELDDAQYQDLALEIRDQLKHYVRRMIYMTLSDAYDFDVVKNVDPFKPFRDFKTYADVPRRVRLLTQYFWCLLRQEQFTRDYTDTLQNRKIWADTQKVLRRDGIIGETIIPYVSRKKLYASLDKLNAYLISPKQKKPSTEPSRGIERPVAPSALTSPTKRLKLSPEADGDQTKKVAFNESKSEDVQELDIPNGPWWGTWPTASPNTLREPLLPSVPVQDDSASTTETDSEWEHVPRATAPSSAFPPLSLRQKSNQAVPQADPANSAAIPFGTDKNVNYMPSQQSQLTSQLPLSGQHQDFPSTERLPQNDGPQTQSDPADRSQSRAQRIQGSPWDYTSNAKAGHANQPTASDHFNERRAAKSPATATATGPETTHPSKPFDFPWDNSFSATFDSSATPNPPMAPPTTTTSITRRVLQELPQPPTNIFKYSTDRPAIYPSLLLSEISTAITTATNPITTPGYVSDGTCDFDVPSDELSTLLCLSENEWKYLPLWAGGLDDGTGGVFDDGVEVPDAPDVGEIGGFRGGVRGLAGSTVDGDGDGEWDGDSEMGSEFEEIRTENGISTIGRASRWATEGRTETVVSLDE